MNIPELSTALANTQVMNQVGIAVLDKALENSETAGESLIQMMDRSMELSVNPHIGSNIDLFI
ncbi:MAG: YjfB family protein [Lachnospiraceae bacterium]|nr:YjfB family protein [Lachnospiraceae bacterium]